jgi:probable H4MPT-linked C1 transfer pathway protein
LKQPGFCGWDIGGAHLKVARCDSQGRLEQVIQLPCALWRGIDELQQSLRLAIDSLDCAHDTHAITMTGELVDAFAHRREGVSAIIDCVCQILASQRCHIYAGKQGWLEPEQAKTNWKTVASMNWLASAAFAASQAAHGLFIDIGSTTCDIVPFSSHQLSPLGLTDHERQLSGSLVYTGAIRTPLISLATEAPLNGKKLSLAAEWFASSADIWVLLGKLNADMIQDSSADGMPWTTDHCRQRLARMLAADADDASQQQWQSVAQWFAEKQLQRISEACLQVMTACPQADDSPLVGAGVGRFITEMLAIRLNRPYIDFASLCQSQPAAADHAPAAALALLAAQQLS